MLKGNLEVVAAKGNLIISHRNSATGCSLKSYPRHYENIPHPWIRKCLRLFGIADYAIGLLDQNMKTWKTELSSGKEV